MEVLEPDPNMKRFECTAARLKDHLTMWAGTLQNVYNGTHIMQKPATIDSFLWSHEPRSARGRVDAVFRISFFNISNQTEIIEALHYARWEAPEAKRDVGKPLLPCISIERC